MFFSALVHVTLATARMKYQEVQYTCEILQGLSIVFTQVESLHHRQLSIAYAFIITMFA
jgi:hypothetical protein